MNAGATWVDEPAFLDGTIVWGRVVEDIPDFCRELVAAIEEPADDPHAASEVPTDRKGRADSSRDCVAVTLVPSCTPTIVARSGRGRTCSIAAAWRSQLRQERRARADPVEVVMTAYQQLQTLERLRRRRSRLDQLGVEPDRHVAFRVVDEELRRSHPGTGSVPPDRAPRRTRSSTGKP